eukprot:UN31644
MNYVYRKDNVGYQQLRATPRYEPTFDFQKTFIQKQLDKLTPDQNKWMINLQADDWVEKYHAIYTGCPKDKRDDMVKAYLEGMVWVLDYYVNGIHDWNWYYNQHYAPTLKDLVNADKSNFYFNIKHTTPVKPSIQLLSVMPATNFHFSAKCYQNLYTHPKLQQWYPDTFKRD